GLVGRLGEDLTIVGPVGGGGLAAGVGLASGRAVTVGVEAERSRAVSAALRAGRIERVLVGPTLADALAGNLEPGSVTVPLIAGHGTEVVAVGEEAIAAAMRHLFDAPGVGAE